MHELGLCDAILKMVDGVLEKEDIQVANKVILEIGELSGVVKKFMEDCWVAVTSETKYENTTLEIELTPGIAQCLDCREQFRAIEYNLKCPRCKSTKLTPIAGTEMVIKEIEAY